jgi:hypothetical protein
MKSLSAIRLVTLLISCSLVVSSCKHDHDIQKRPFKASTKTWYRISPTTPAMVNVGGINYTTFAHVPGGGTGNATHLGNIKTWFNQLVFTSYEAPIPEGSLVASVVDVITYPVTGAPLPLIQAGDFSGLANINSTLLVPEQVLGKVVSSFFYNDKGDAVFLSNSSVSYIIPVSATRNEFNGKALIVGGRGKFSHATGEVDFEGYFNPNNPEDAEYGVDGWIAY